MAGLGVVLEAQKSSNINNKTSQPQVINKTTMNTMFSTSTSTSTSTSSINQPPDSSPFETSTFLHQCFLCNKRLLPGKDIYMYKGDRGFCSVDCRCKQILKDEEETIQKENCSLAARHHRKGPTNQPDGVA